MSRFKHDYSIDRHIVEALGGLPALVGVKQRVEALDLPPCPFCGGEAVVILASTYGQPSVAVACDKCHGRTVLAGAGYNYLTETQTDIYDALDTVAQRWGRRWSA